MIRTGRMTNPSHADQALPVGIYLAVDLGCQACRALGDLIHVVGRGRVRTLDLRNTMTRHLLDQVQPGWRPAPYLIIVGRTTRAWTGIRGIVHLFGSLGPVATWKVFVGSRQIPASLLPPLRRRGAGKSDRHALSEGRGE
jgi:hypothetical protein